MKKGADMGGKRENNAFDPVLEFIKIQSTFQVIVLYRSTTTREIDENFQWVDG